MDEKRIFAKNLNFYMDRYGKSQVDLINDLGVNKSTISTWCNGTKMPRMGTIQTLADYFGIMKSDLIEANVASNLLANSSKGVRIPVLGRIPAGIPIEAIEDVLDYEEIPAELTAGGKEYFALKIQGSSMYPKYLEDDVVIFQKSPDCENGTDCAVLVNGEDATFKKVIKQSNGVVLQPLNISDFEPAFYSNEDVETLPVVVIGIAREIRRKL